MSKATGHFDCLIIGAGISGLVTAQHLANKLGLSSLIVDRRDHIGGNCYDYYDSTGVLTHKYGPHYFRTNSQRIVDYLSQFTEWLPTNYEIRSFVDDKFWNFPINLNTFETLIGKKATSAEFQKWLEAERVPIKNPANSEEVIISQVGWQLYEKFFKGYTEKQWQMNPKDLDASVCGRIPIRTNRNDRYLREEFQALPKAGYTATFNKMLDSADSKITMALNTDWQDIRDKINYKRLIYSGSIDSYFNHVYGKLPYRSLRFEHESFEAESLKEREHISKKKGHWQPSMQVNYPDRDVPYTRIVEIKHGTQQDIPNSSIVREFPADYTPETEPYYPVPFAKSQALYKKYQQLSLLEKNVTFTGRLATYRYYNMDQVIGMALKEADKIIKIWTNK
jgi:UDP-galactopyranose mutase